MPEICFALFWVSGMGFSHSETICFFEALHFLTHTSWRDLSTSASVVYKEGKVLGFPEGMLQESLLFEWQQHRFSALPNDPMKTEKHNHRHEANGHTCHTLF